MAGTKTASKPAPVAAPAAAPAKAPAKKAAPAAPAAPAPVSSKAPAVSPPPETVDGTGPDSFSELASLLTNLLSQVKEAQAKLKVVTKENEKLRKVVEKAEKKKAKARNSANGFAKPTKISDEMCDFLGVAKGTEMSRTDVTRRITAYIREHKLQKPENKRLINPDAKLKKILNPAQGEDVTYFNIQRLIKGHFVTAANAAA